MAGLSVGSLIAECPGASAVSRKVQRIEGHHPRAPGAVMRWSVPIPISGAVLSRYHRPLAVSEAGADVSQSFWTVLSQGMKRPSLEVVMMPLEGENEPLRAFHGAVAASGAGAARCPR
jgi:hypothetical protein